MDRSHSNTHANRKVRSLLGREGAGGDVAVFASEIANLARLRLGVVTRWHLTTDIGVDVRTSGDTIPARRYRHGMDMVHCPSRIICQSNVYITCHNPSQRRGHTERTIGSFRWEPRQVDAEHYTSAIGVAGRLDGTTDGGVGEGVGRGQRSLVGDTGGVSLNDLRIAELACGAWDDGAIEGWVTLDGDGGRWGGRRWVLRADQSQAGEGDGEDGGVHVGGEITSAGVELDVDCDRHVQSVNGKLLIG